jgi:thiamine biosynthesis lipoprotein
MKRTLILVLVTSVAIGCSLRLAPSPSVSAKASEVRYVMGTLLEITLYAPSKEAGLKALDETFAEAQRLDSMLSTWKPESPVSVFNRERSILPQPVPFDLYEIVSRSRHLSELTDGAFTLGVRPLVEVWEMAAKRNEAPTHAEVRRVRSRIAPDNFITSLPSSIAKRDPHAMIETGGVGKGYAVDAMLTLLRSRGITQAFINFGRSSMGALGAPPAATGWKVNVALTEGSSDGEVELRDETLSVSRARGTPFVIQGKAYAHIFDPVTAMPVQSSRGAALRGPSATDGEAFVKYLVIRGAPSRSVAQRWERVEWIVRAGESLHRSPGFLK